MKLSTIDENDPDQDDMRLVHGIIETSNKAAWQPLELLKASRGAPDDESVTGPLPTPVYRIVDGT
jgi:hypothetical protein